ncbi:putative CDC45-like protein [Lyophyllum shimeji]|uniref:CDC45-like protein n=1 Tax=Lyophyllum shimeji TaxID=47721 RepID=A0A9P3UJ51_LYOSH|nr:putative CDC45-like protein [Lyophyllum shimeji]
MVVVPPPQLASGARPSYAETYAAILAEYRSAPLVSASSVVILAAADVDALCAARMLSNLFKQDDVIHRIIPIPGHHEFVQAREEIVDNDEVRTLILLNLGGLHDLSTEGWFGSANPKLSTHIIDSLRPIHPGNWFMGERVYVWDDGQAENFQDLEESFEVITFHPDYGSDLDESDLSSESEEEDDVRSEDEDDEEYGDRELTSGKRRSLGDGDSKAKKKRRRTSRERTDRMPRDEYLAHRARVDKYFHGGSSYGQSASATIYVLASVLERVDNDLLWLAILGLTYQYTTSRISRESYETYHSIYYDEVSRLNPPPPAGALTSLNPDDTSLRASDELRFILFRHWNLQDAMFHSSYVASKLGIWKERGRKRLTGLLAKMGFSIPQTQQPYAHMDMDLKKDLLQKLNDIAPEYGLVELSYPSFMRCFGYRSQPLSAADAVEGISALLDVASGFRMEVEIEGARNGGEWFGGGRLWEADAGRDGVKRRSIPGNDREPPAAAEAGRGETNGIEGAEGDEAGIETRLAHHWWSKNFWSAFDALDNIDRLREALTLSMSLHRAIIRQGTSMIDKQDIRTMRNYRVAVLSQGPDLAIFTHPSVLSRLALWLVDALRDRVPGGTIGGRTKRKGLPFVVACLNEKADTYTVVGIMAALDFGDVRKNEFSTAFIAAREKCGIHPVYSSFDASVLEIPQRDLKIFLDALCDGSEGP